MVDYVPRLADVWYVPHADSARALRGGRAMEAADVLPKGLDLIVKEDDKPENTIRKDDDPTFYFHRPATVYMLATASPDEAGDKQPTYPEWTSVGWYQTSTGNTENIELGIRRKRPMSFDDTVYVFSKSTVLQDGRHTIGLPSKDFVYRKSSHLAQT